MLMKKIIILIVLYCSICISSYGQCPTSIQEFINPSDLDFIFAGTPNCADVPQPATVIIEGITYSFCCCFSNELGGTSAISVYGKSVPTPHPVAPYTIDFGGQVCEYQSGGVLPITFSSISVSSSDRIIEVKWETETEVHGDYFEIQRSIGSPDDFTALATVQSQGNTRSISPYVYQDFLEITGTVYYRIKAVDLNGVSTFSSIAALQMDKHATFNISSNLVSNELSWNLPVEYIDELVIYNIRGDIMYNVHPESQSIPIDFLENGMYFIKSRGTFGESKTIKFIKN